jgi:hypothetical protein
MAAGAVQSDGPFSDLIADLKSVKSFHQLHSKRCSNRRRRMVGLPGTVTLTYGMVSFIQLYNEHLMMPSRGNSQVLLPLRSKGKVSLHPIYFTETKPHDPSASRG